MPNQRFAKLLKEGISSVAKREDINVGEVEARIATALSYSKDAVTSWRLRGIMPDETNRTRILEYLVDYCVKSGRVDRTWAENLLKVTHYPNPAQLLNEVFPSPFAAPPENPHPLVTWGTAPQSPTTVIGREHDIDHLYAQLTQKNKNVICVVCGLPGVGKSTLVSALAHDPRLSREFPDGLLWAVLGESPDLMVILGEWMTALGLQPQQYATSESRKNRLAAVLRDKRMLLIVDDAWHASHVNVLRVGGNNCRMLITTREHQVHLDLFVPAAYHLGELSKEASITLLSELTQNAVEIDPNSLELLVQKLGGLPLALRVAGRLLATEAAIGLGVQNLLAELTEGKRILEERAPIDLFNDAKLSTATLADLFQKSTDRLEEKTRKHFAQLGIIAQKPATIDDEAAAALWGVKKAHPILSALVSRGLLEPVTSGRFQMHTLLRSHAQMLLESNEQEYLKCQEKYVDYCLKLAKSYKASVTTYEKVESLTKLNINHPHFVSVQEILVNSHTFEKLKLLVDLHIALQEYYQQRGLWSEQIQILKKTIEALQTVEISTQLMNERDQCLGELEIQLAHLLRRQLNNLDDALDYCLSGLKRRDVLAIGSDYRILGDIYRIRGEFRQALQSYQNAEKRLLSKTALKERGQLLSSVADVYLHIARPQMALDYALKSLKIQLEVQDRYEIAQSHRSLADIYIALKDLEKARWHVEQARSLFEGDKQESNPIMGWVLRSQGDISLLLNNPQQAELCYQKALEIFEKQPVGSGIAIIRKKIALWNLCNGDMQASLTEFDEALGRARAIKGAKYTLTDVLVSRIGAGQIAEKILTKPVPRSPQIDSSALGKFIEKNKVLQQELAQLVTSIGISTSVSRSEDFDPLDTLACAGQNSFRVVQIFLNPAKVWMTDAEKLNRVVNAAYNQGVQLICHAPNPLGKQGLYKESPFVPEPMITKTAKILLQNNPKKWMVYHFDERIPLDETVDRVVGLNEEGLVPCIENYHFLKIPEAAYRNFNLYFELFCEIERRGLHACAVIDISRFFDATLGLKKGEAMRFTEEIFQKLEKLNIPIILHLIDSKDFALDRSQWCAVGEGVIPYKMLLKQLFSSAIQVEAVIFEFEDKITPQQSLPFLNKCIYEGLSSCFPKLAIPWISSLGFDDNEFLPL